MKEAAFVGNNRDISHCEIRCGALCASTSNGGCDAAAGKCYIVPVNCEELGANA